MKKIFFVLSVLLSFSLSAQYNSLLWKITGNGLKKPSYLYGTMHTSDARVFNFSDSLMQFFNASKAYAMELDPVTAFDFSLISKITMGKGLSLKKMIPDTDYVFLDSVMRKEVGLSVKIFDNVAPVFTMSLLEMKSMGLSDSSIKGNKEVLDVYFHNLARKKKKKLIGIETVEEQLGALNSLTYQEQADMLLVELHAMRNNSSEGTELVEYYLQQDLDKLAAMNSVTDMPGKFYTALVTDRNIRMADRIAVFIQEQPVFVAIGALHLPGTGGVIELLRKKGYTVYPVR
ncbi:MAG TPA: TraB/GumN family protein [Chitinophagales bacterium]|nr:TraB/GumN family protein [Chitinophagales bacterium]